MTGATGFVGSHVVPSLLAEGHVLVSGVRAAGRAPAGTTELVVGDIDGGTNWHGALEGVDAVVHLAARVHVMKETAEDALGAFRRVNTMGTLALARAAAEQGVRRFVFMSSIKVNGEDTSRTPSFSRLSPPNPRDPYAVSKHDAEVGLRELSRETGMEVVILRPPVVYGSGVGGNIRRIASAVARGIPLPLGAVDNRRTMVGVENLVEAVAAALRAEAAPDFAVLLGDPAPVSTRDLVRLLAQGMNRPARLVPVPVGLLKTAGTVLGRRPEVDRLVGDLVIEPDWPALGITVDDLTSPEQLLPALGAEFASHGSSAP